MLERFLYPIFRRVDFRGKGRLRRILPVRAEGTASRAFPGGFRLRLDLRESLQRDFLFGLYDRRELDLVREHLGDGDFVDVGAHVGLYTVAAALHGPGRVLAFEPNPSAREQLDGNLALNELRRTCSSFPKAVGDAAGTALLHVPATPDPSFSSLAGGRFAEGEPIDVEVTTVDAEVEAAGLAPSVVKIDVEGGELAVVGGHAANARATSARAARRGERSERARARADGSTATRASASAGGSSRWRRAAGCSTRSSCPSRRSDPCTCRRGARAASSR